MRWFGFAVARSGPCRAPVLLLGAFLMMRAVLMPGAASVPGAVPVAGAAPVAGAGPMPTVSRTAAVPAAGFVWPLSGAPAVVRGFNPPPRPWLAGHRGVDLGAGPGQRVRVAGAGVVVFAGVIAGRGVVSVEHPGGLRTTYEPVTPTVSAGQRLATGAWLGRLAAGHRGCPVDACLHWGLRHGGHYLDPLALLGAGRVRLLPLATPSGSAGRPYARG